MTRASPKRLPVIAAWVGAICCGLLAVGVFFPARWLHAWVAQASAQHVQWIHTTGSIWQGQTQWRLTGGDGANDAQVLPGLWSWTLRPSWQAGPALTLRVEATCCLATALQLVLRPRLNQAPQWQLSDVQLALPLNVLQGLGTPWNTLQLQGRLVLRSQGLRSNGSDATQGQLTLSARDVASRLSTVTPLGDYEASIRWAPKQLPQVSLQTLGGHLQLQGQGQLAQGRLRFRGQASASADSEGALDNLLNIIGRRAGRVSLLTIG